MKKTVVISDLSGETLTDPKRVVIEIESKRYELDLSVQEVEKLQDKYGLSSVPATRATTTVTTTVAKPQRKSSPEQALTPDQRSQAKQWAIDNKIIKKNHRGRLKASIYEDWKKATS